MGKDEHGELTPQEDLDNLIEEGLKLLKEMDEMKICSLTSLIEPIKTYQAKIGAIGMLVELGARVIKDSIKEEEGVNKNNIDNVVFILQVIKFLERLNSEIGEAMKDTD